MIKIYNMSEMNLILEDFSAVNDDMITIRTNNNHPRVL